MNLIDKDYIDIEFLQKELIEAKYKGDLTNESLQVWWKILAKWREMNERKGLSEKD